MLYYAIFVSFSGFTHAFFYVIALSLDQRGPIDLYPCVVVSFFLFVRVCVKSFRKLFPRDFL